MELRYPLLFIIVLIIFIILLLLIKKKTKTYENDGSIVANTYIIKNSDLFKSKLKKYNFIKKLIVVLLVISIGLCSLLIARPSQELSSSRNEYNRDIFLCMDVSVSVDELNMELIDNLKDTVKSLKGERFGISIFNTSSIILVPLTDDYEYILNELDKLYKSIDCYNNSSRCRNVDDYFSVYNYRFSGTLEGNEIKGSSLIGEGLAACVYSFPKLDEDRSRIIIFSTDNELAAKGEPLVTTKGAALIAKEKGIKVFGIGTKVMKNSDRVEFIDAVSSNGGKYYDHNSSTVRSIVSDIDATSKSLLKQDDVVYKVDVPQVFFILLVVTTFLFILFSRKVVK